MPREIRITPTWQVAVGFVLWALLAGGFGYYGALRGYEDYCFTHHSVPVTGKVVQKYYTISHGRHGDTTTYHVSYHYEAGNMIGFCRQTIQYATYHFLREGGPVPVMYLRENPAKVRGISRSKSAPSTCRRGFSTRWPAFSFLAAPSSSGRRAGRT